MATFSLEESDAHVSADPAVVTMASVAIGDILIAVGTERSGTTHANHTLGWNGTDTPTKAGGFDNEISDSNARCSASLWYTEITTADGTDLSFDDGTSNQKNLLAFRLRPSAAYDYTVQAFVAAGSGTGSTSPYATGNTANITGGDNNLLQVSAGAWRNATGSPESIAFANTDDETTSLGVSNARSLALAFMDEVADGVQSDSISFTGSGHEGIAMTMIFSDGSLGGGGGIAIPVAMHHYKQMSGSN